MITPLGCAQLHSPERLTLSNTDTDIHYLNTNTEINKEFWLKRNRLSKKNLSVSLYFCLSLCFFHLAAGHHAAQAEQKASVPSEPLVGVMSQ